jgi:hypothetical protein
MEKDDTQPIEASNRAIQLAGSLDLDMRASS